MIMFGNQVVLFFIFFILFCLNFQASLKFIEVFHSAFTCSKLTIETREQDVKYVQS